MCPDESPSQETHVIDLTSFMDGRGSEVLNMFDRIMNSEDGLQGILKLITSSLTGMKDDQNS